jgi:hypothetical protein
MFPVNSIFSPVSLGCSVQDVDEALERVRVARERRQARIAAGELRPNDVVVRDGVVIVTLAPGPVGERPA